MHKILCTLLLFAVVSLLLPNKAIAQTGNSSAALLRHIVMVTFKPDAPADSIKALDDLYTSLSKSPLAKDFEMGVNVSARDTLVKHVYVTTFASKDDMDNYKKIPSYARLFKISLAVADEVNVADYYIEK